MKMTEGELTAWNITAELLQDLDRVDLEFMPEIVDTWYTNPKSIGRAPGAFDFDPNLANSMALVLFGVVSTALKDALPKLFDASIDVGKEVIKKIATERIKNSHSEPIPEPPARDPARLREIVRVAVLEQELGTAAAEAVANSVIAKLVTTT